MPSTTEAPTKPQVAVKDPTILYYYQPTMPYDRTAHSLVLLVKIKGKIKRVNIQRALNPMPREEWEALDQSAEFHKLLKSDQLFHVADSPNLVRDFIPNQSSLGMIKIEQLLDRCNPNMLEDWAIWIKNQDATNENKYAEYLRQINQRMESRTNFLPPEASNKPINPAKAIEAAGDLGRI